MCLAQDELPVRSAGSSENTPGHTKISPRPHRNSFGFWTAPAQPQAFYNRSILTSLHPRFLPCAVLARFSLPRQASCPSLPDLLQRRYGRFLRLSSRRFEISAVAKQTTIWPYRYSNCPGPHRRHYSLDGAISASRVNPEAILVPLIFRSEERHHGSIHHSLGVACKSPDNRQAREKRTCQPQKSTHHPLLAVL
jgi:hypothetical protein